MHLLIPKLTPVQLVLYLSALVVCWLYGDGTTSEVLYGLPPLLAAGLLLTSVAAAAAPKIIEGVKKKKALKNIKGSAEYKATKKLSRKAEKRLEEGDYGLTEAEMAKGVGEARRSYEADIKGSEAALARSGSDPFGAGRRRALANILRKGSGDVAAKSRTQQQALSAQIAAGEMASDKATLQQALATKTAIEQGQAAAGTAIGTGIAQGVGTGVSMGTQAAGQGLFQGVDRTAQGEAIAQNFNQRASAVQPAGTPPPVGA